MIKDDPKIRAMMHGDAVEYLAAYEKISITEARDIISKLSFSEYRNMVEAVTPPSGQTIGPAGPTTGTPTNTSQAATAPAATPGNVKSIWPGKGAPVEVGMTVGTKGPDGMPAPGQISQVDMGAKGVKVKNPATGQDEWTNMDELQPFMANGQPGAAQPAATGQDPATVATAMEEAKQLSRLRELSGIKESSSAGATSAGNISVSPAALNTVRSRQPQSDKFKKEYVPKEAAKTIVGDTKPNQASGELSSNLAVRGKATASRFNNGYKK